MIHAILIAVVFCSLGCNLASAQVATNAELTDLQVRPQVRSDDAASKLGEPGRRWMLVCCGLPGDETHREKLTLAVQQIAQAAEGVFQVPPSRFRVLVGDETMVDEVKDSKVRTDICTGNEIAKSLGTLSKQIQANDSVWMILLGHAQLYSGRSTFNVQGRDFDAKDLSKWLTGVPCRDKVLMLTMPVSGFWIKPLRGPRTVVISATDADFEFTGTEMPYALANVVSGNSAQPLADIDQDGGVSLLDLYLATCLEVHSTFKSLDRLQTEHALIDDNGDGVGRELQEPFIPVEAIEGESPAKSMAVKPIITANSDGDFARTLQLNKPIVVSSGQSTE